MLVDSGRCGVQPMKSEGRRETSIANVRHLVQLSTNRFFDLRKQFTSSEFKLKVREDMLRFEPRFKSRDPRPFRNGRKNQRISEKVPEFLRSFEPRKLEVKRPNPFFTLRDERNPLGSQRSQRCLAISQTASEGLVPSFEDNPISIPFPEDCNAILCPDSVLYAIRNFNDFPYATPGSLVHSRRRPTHLKPISEGAKTGLHLSSNASESRESKLLFQSKGKQLVDSSFSYQMIDSSSQIFFRSSVQKDTLEVEVDDGKDPNLLLVSTKSRGSHKTEVKTSDRDRKQKFKTLAEQSLRSSTARVSRRPAVRNLEAPTSPKFSAEEEHYFNSKLSELWNLFSAKDSNVPSRQLRPLCPLIEKKKLPRPLFDHYAISSNSIRKYRSYWMDCVEILLSSENLFEEDAGYHSALLIKISAERLPPFPAPEYPKDTVQLLQGVLARIDADFNLAHRS